MGLPLKKEIAIPFNFIPRDYQEDGFYAINEGYLRGVEVYHRRSGKEKTGINRMICQMLRRKGAYYYLFPTKAQGKKILWEGADAEGFRFLDHFPKEIIKRVNSTELLIELTNDSIFQIGGTDDWNNLMGTNPVGIQFSEFSLQDPRVWDYFRPILAENGGWAFFNFTPRGDNHGKVLYDMALANPDWFCKLLTVDDTARPDGSPVITQKAIQEDIDSGMADEMVQQEYYCSFVGSILGAYFAKQMQKAEDDGRICSIPYDERFPVDTDWDLGMDDSMTIWFSQEIGREVRFIDYFETTGEGFPSLAKILDKRGYKYGTHYMPHDVAVREIGTGKARKKVAEELGIKPVVAVPKVKQKEDGIAAIRGILSRCSFDKVKTKLGRDALKNYQKVWDDKNKVFRNTPLHNWASHGADGFQTFAVRFKDKVSPKPEVKSRSYRSEGGWLGN